MNSDAVDEELKSYCSLCGLEMQGGVWTNGDPYGDARKLGADVPPMRGYCWSCVKERSDEIPNFGKAIKDILASRKLCGFLMSWVGHCKEPKPCAKHKDLTCSSCGVPATHDCDSTGQFVCGVPLCDECGHMIFPDGTNGGVGFNAQDLPEGMKQHCKKSEQRYQPWYAKKISDDQQPSQAS